PHSFFVVLSPLAALRRLPPFPTRRSSDLPAADGRVDRGADPRAQREGDGERRPPAGPAAVCLLVHGLAPFGLLTPFQRGSLGAGDRKSTRLNSSHRTISYAVFCLKKKTEP